MKITIRPTQAGDKDWIANLMDEWWAGPTVVLWGRTYEVDKLPGLIAEKDGEPAGLVTYHIDADECEVVTLNSLEECFGVGTALLEAIVKQARKEGCRLLRLITTNDNTNALRFYQVRGLKISELRRDAITVSRKLKPGIPFIGHHGIPIRDEIELDMHL